MAESKSTWRVNRTGMKTCCYATLQMEMHRRMGAREELMKYGDMVTCDKCRAEMACDKGTANRLRWRAMNFGK